MLNDLNCQFPCIMYVGTFIQRGLEGESLFLSAFRKIFAHTSFAGKTLTIHHTGKVRPTTDHKGPEGCRSIALFFL
jgi:hypothetical protein